MRRCNTTLEHHDAAPDCITRSLLTFQNAIRRPPPPICSRIFASWSASKDVLSGDLQEHRAVLGHLNIDSRIQASAEQRIEHVRGRLHWSIDHHHTWYCEFSSRCTQPERAKLHREK